MGARAVSSSFACFWVPFPLLGCLFQSKRGRVSLLIVPCHSMFSWYPWKSCSSLKGDGGPVDLAEKAGEGTMRKGGTGTVDGI